MENLKVVATFTNELDADLAQATLSAGGIDSYIRNDDIGGMLPALQESTGVKLLVEPASFEEARALLSEQATSQE
ncbi:MAG TPA: DUF2007 domain-containing protein [Bacteroidota bacterium]|nr:DUF2007 domain-containing protein [Bacteroidota bacterium]